MGTITFQRPIQSFQNGHTLSSIVEWYIYTPATGVNGVGIASHVSPNGWGVEYNLPDGNPTTTDSPVQVIVTFPGADLSGVGHIFPWVYIAAAGVGGSGIGFDFSSAFQLQFVFAQDEATFDFTGETEADFRLPIGTFGIFPDTAHGYNSVVGRTIESWNWDFGDGDTTTTAVNTVQHTYTTFPSGGFSVGMQAVDQYDLVQMDAGAVIVAIEGYWHDFVLPTEDGHPVSSLTDTFGFTYIALKTDDGVQVIREHGGGYNNRQNLFLRTGFRNPSLYRAGGSRLFLFGQASDGVWWLYYSDDCGETFTYMAQPFGNDTTFKKRRANGGDEGDGAATAIKDGFVWFTHSWDNVNWSDPINIGIESTTAADVHYQGGAGCARWVIVASGGTYKSSRADGAAGSWTAL